MTISPGGAGADVTTVAGRPDGRSLRSLISMEKSPLDVGPGCSEVMASRRP